MEKTTTLVASAANLAKVGEEAIPALLEQVRVKIKSMSGPKEADASTKDKVLPGFGKLAAVKSVSVLVQAHSSVVNRAKVFKESADKLGVDTIKFPFKLEGCTASAWERSIKHHVSRLINEKEIINLKKAEKLLEENLSADAKRKQALQEIAGMFSDTSPLE